MTPPRLLDLYSGAGIGATGYARAGFDVVGVDILPQPNYPFDFIQADALTFPLEGFDVIHASCPCQAFSPLRSIADGTYPDLIARTRARLQNSGVPWVMENVPQAPLIDPIILCGSMFDLPIKRHRAFESSIGLESPVCNHARWAELWPEGFSTDVSNARRDAGASVRSPVVGVYGNGGNRGDLPLWCWAMGAHAVTRRDITEAIPPRYTQYLGRQLLLAIGR